MELEIIHSIAASHGINPDALSKTELIKAIQNQEGNFDCFETALSGECDQGNCLWLEDCLGMEKE
ncbi:MAG: SAP domain-containing protein [Gallionella sp.]|nr:SAP domain-containing protein [Gallionella sp.]MDD4960238.1 SAP domain-containing protein [Gallionella sp.]